MQQLFSPQAIIILHLSSLHFHIPGGEVQNLSSQLPPSRPLSRKVKGGILCPEKLLFWLFPQRSSSLSNPGKRVLSPVPETLGPTAVASLLTPAPPPSPPIQTWIDQISHKWWQGKSCLCFKTTEKVPQESLSTPQASRVKQSWASLHSSHICCVLCFLHTCVLFLKLRKKIINVIFKKEQQILFFFSNISLSDCSQH